MRNMSAFPSLPLEMLDTSVLQLCGRVTYAALKDPTQDLMLCSHSLAILNIL